MLRGGTGMPWALPDGQGFRSWRRAERAVWVGAGGAFGGGWGGQGGQTGPRKARTAGRGSRSTSSCRCQSGQEPGPFLLGPGESVYGSRMVLIGYKTGPGTQMSPAAFGISKISFGGILDRVQRGRRPVGMWV